MSYQQKTVGDTFYWRALYKRNFFTRSRMLTRDLFAVANLVFTITSVTIIDRFE